MEILRTLNTVVAGDSDEALLDNWPIGMPAEGVYLDLDMPVSVGVAGTPALVDLKNVLAYFLGVFNLQYGAEKQHKPFIGVAGDKLRHAHRAMTMVEVWNDFVGIAQGLGAHTFHARMFITPNRQKADGKNRLIGWTQGRSMFVQVREGAALTAGALTLTRGAGNAVCRIVPAYRVGGDTFTHLPHYREVNRAAQDVQGPDGKCIAAWDDNAAFAATVIGKYSVRIGDRELLRQVEPKYENVDYARDIDAGGSNFTDEVTLFYAADPFADEREVPTGVPYIKLVNQDVASIKGRFLYLPVIEEGEATRITAESARSRGEDVVTTITNIPERGELNGHVATAELEVIGKSDPRFGSESGLHADDKGNVSVFVPPGLAEAGKALPAFARQRAQKVQSLRVPGSTTTGGAGRSNSIRGYVRSVFGF